MAKEGSANFEIPAEMRAFAEKSVEQAKQAFDTFISAAQQAVNTAENQVASARTGPRRRASSPCALPSAMSRSSFEFAQRLLHAKDFNEVTALQAEYVKSQIAALTEQAKELSKQASKVAGQGH